MFLYVDKYSKRRIETQAGSSDFIEITPGVLIVSCPLGYKVYFYSPGRYYLSRRDVGNKLPVRAQRDQRHCVQGRSDRNVSRRIEDDNW